MPQNWPKRLWLVRHGQSQGNIARDKAQQAGSLEIGIDVRDVDVPLSDLGFEQAEATGHWFAALPEDERPEVLLSSPYLRARQTAEAICKAGGLTGRTRTIVDERLREREFGVFDRLTTLGIREKYPEEAAHRKMLGKFYHRPPGGESWADVILRLRSALNTINLHYRDRRVLVVCHQVVVLCMRYILEELDEAGILKIDRQADILNCGICAYDFQENAHGLCVP
jgi:broad specificity phosphatase PhoE